MYVRETTEARRQCAVLAGILAEKEAHHDIGGPLAIKDDTSNWKQRRSTQRASDRAGLPPLRRHVESMMAEYIKLGRETAEARGKCSELERMLVA